MPGDAVTTANNIMANEFLLRISIASWLILTRCDQLVLDDLTHNHQDLQDHLFY